MPRPAAVNHESALESALELFWERGCRQVSIDDLIRQTGLNRHALYGRYRNKDGLVVAALERYCSEGTRRVKAVLQGPGSPRERLQHLLHLRDPDCGDPFWRNMLDRGCFAMRLRAELKDEHAEVTRVVAGTIADLKADVSALVREGQELGEFRRDLSDEVLVTTIMSVWVATPLMPDEHRKGATLAAVSCVEATPGKAVRGPAAGGNRTVEPS